MSDWEEDADSNAIQANYEKNLNNSRRCGSPPPDTHKNRRENGSRVQRRYDRDRRGGSYKQTIDVRSDCIGMIIGKGGSNIQRLESDYHVRVNLDRSSGTLTVSGNDEGNVQCALDNIKVQMKKSDNGRGSGGRYGRGCQDKDIAYKSRYDDERGGSTNYQSTDDFYGRGSKDEKDYSGVSSFNDDNNQDTGGLIDWDTLNKRAEEARRQRWAKCPPLTKNFYEAASEVANLTRDEVERIRLKNNNITVSRVFKAQDGTPDDIPNPIWKFEQCFSAYPDLLAEISKQNFEKPSPIQSQAWPILLKGEDMIGIAQTGTGKTLAFLLPAMIHTEYQSIPRCERGGPNVLVMAPTRELALQIEKEVNKYQFRGMKA